MSSLNYLTTGFRCVRHVFSLKKKGGGGVVVSNGILQNNYLNQQFLGKEAAVYHSIKYKKLYQQDVE